jgi:hypothetical protein
LRMPLQHSLEPESSYKQLLASVAQVTDTAERIASFYDGVLVTLAARYRSYLDRTDKLLDAPTVRILENIAAEQARMIREAHDLVTQLPQLALKQHEPLDRILTMERAMGTFVIHRPEHTSAGAP